MEEAIKRKCSGCEEVFDLNIENFYINGINKQGYRFSHQCRGCRTASLRINRQKKRDAKPIIIVEKPTTRRCGICKDIFSLTLEYFVSIGKGKLSFGCKVCRRIQHKEYRKNNPHKFCTNPELRKLDQAKYKDQYRVYWREWSKRAYITNINRHISVSLRGRLWHAMKAGKAIKSKTTLELLGCSIEQLKAHLENQFIEGMTWENHGKWHIDHIRPFASFDLTDIQQQKQRCNYINLQPLWKPDNLSKGSKFQGINYKTKHNKAKCQE